MADKEERILVLKATEDDFIYKHFNGKGFIPRQEAIEKMAKVMCHSPFESCEGCIVQKKKQACKQALEGMKGLAEAALNALLEGKCTR